jgi:hypothetical protein
MWQMKAAQGDKGRMLVEQQVRRMVGSLFDPMFCHRLWWKCFLKKRLHPVDIQSDYLVGTLVTLDHDSDRRREMLRDRDLIPAVHGMYAEGLAKCPPCGIEFA